MTSLAIVRRRLSIGLSALGMEVLAVAVLALTVLAAAVLALTAPAEAGDPSRASARLTPAKAAALIAATSATPEQIRAVGDKAQLINAALPFSSAPVQAARPFAIGDDLDHRRALLCLTQAVYYEAGFEPLTGRRAVAQVVLNRMRHPAFPKSVCGVVYQGSRSPVCQFSFVCDGSLYRAPAQSSWREAKLIAEAALAGYVEASVGAATHYHADYVAPYWAPKLTKIAKFGAHIFYRWPGGWGRQAAFTGRYAGEPQDPLALRPPLRTAPNATPIEGQPVIAEVAIAAGPPIARAPNDVGGLLDVSKGWKLTIPGPDEVNGAAARALAEQQAKSAAPAVPVAATTAPVVATR